MGEPLDYFFDFNHLNRSLVEFCPQMKVYRSMDDLYDVPSVQKAHDISVRVLPVDFEKNTIINDTSVLAQQIKAFVDKASPPSKRTHPVRFHLATTNWAFPTSADSPAFARHFGRLLRVREDDRRLAALVLYHLQKRFGLELDPRQALKNDSFVGVYLKAEMNSDYMFVSLEDAVSDMLGLVERLKPKVVFAMTGGDGEEMNAFVAQAKDDLNITVVQSKDLLQDQDLRALNGLTWDQRAWVDYEVMLRAGLMAGPAESSLAWGLALRRAGASGASNVSNGSSGANAASYIRWQDSHSTIFGKAETSLVFEETVWP